jgi:REP element-mobilizing transposase RayT
MERKTENYKTFGKNRSLRLKEFHYKGPYVYFVTSTTCNRQNLFTRSEFAKVIIEQIKKIRIKENFKLYAYCIMPDHLHLLLCPDENGKNLSGVMQLISGRTTKAFWQQGGKDKLWQRGFYDHVARKTEDLREIALYILNNPVRKGLVEKYEDYPFCGLVDELPV